MKVCTLQIAIHKTASSEFSFVELGAVQERSVKVAALQVGGREDGPAELGRPEAAKVEAGTVEHRAAHLSRRKVAFDQRGAMKRGMAECGI